jgi:hypothetical protein
VSDSLRPGNSVWRFRTGLRRGGGHIAANADKPKGLRAEHRLQVLLQRCCTFLKNAPLAMAGAAWVAARAEAVGTREAA